MPLYKYTALSDGGQTIEGTFVAGDRGQILRMIFEKGYHPVSIEAVKERKEIHLTSYLKRIKLRDLAIFCRQFCTMLKAGITIIKCLDILEQQTENKRFKTIINEMFQEVQKGMALSEAMRDHREFPELLVNMVEAGEISGTIDTIMDRMAMHFEKENKLRGKIKTAMVYPVVLCCLATVVVIFLLTFIMPMFIDLITSSGGSLPFPTRVMLKLSDILRSYWYMVIIVVAGGIAGIRYYLRTENGKRAWDKLKLSLPIIKSASTKVYTSRFSRTLATLLSSGIPLLQSLEVVAKVIGNTIVSDGLMNVREEIRKGTDLSTLIKKMGIFPPIIDSMMKVGEESGSLDDLLLKVAGFYDDEVETAMQKLIALLEPLLIIFMALIIGFIIVSMALPLFEMFGAVDRM